MQHPQSHLRMADSANVTLVTLDCLDCLDKINDELRHSLLPQAWFGLSASVQLEQATKKIHKVTADEPVILTDSSDTHDLIVYYSENIRLYQELVQNVAARHYKFTATLIGATLRAHKSAWDFSPRRAVEVSRYGQPRFLDRFTLHLETLAGLWFSVGEVRKDEL